MKLGTFSISLSVKDISLSKEFYEKLGFKVFGGDINQNWLIMQNNSCTVGLFQGMFDKNIMTFNPGWDSNAQKLKDFEDIREIKSNLKNKGINVENETEEKPSGPASFNITDPDGNTILFDQHV